MGSKNCSHQIALYLVPRTMTALLGKGHPQKGFLKRDWGGVATGNFPATQLQLAQQAQEKAKRLD